MERQLREITDADQAAADRREARRLATALAGDVVAYHDALKGAGIDGDLLATLVTQFNSAWVGSDDRAGEVEFSMLFGGDE